MFLKCAHTPCGRITAFFGQGVPGIWRVCLSCPQFMAHYGVGTTQGPSLVDLVISLFPDISVPTSPSSGIQINNCSNVFNVFLKNAVMMSMPIRYSFMFTAIDKIFN